MAYTRRNVGDTVNGAILLRKINNQRWEMKCKCGNVFISQPSCTSGLCRDCWYKYRSVIQLVHGDAVNRTRLYNIWLSMRSRCNNPKAKAYKSYGGRGIKVCDDWDNYATFKDWALLNGYDDSLTIDRINVDGDYCPNNCRWSTMKEQSNNRRNNHKLTFNGKTDTLANWSRLTGISSSTIRERINTWGWSVEEALTIPAARGNNQFLRIGG